MQKINLTELNVSCLLTPGRLFPLGEAGNETYTVAWVVKVSLLKLLQKWQALNPLSYPFFFECVVTEDAAAATFWFNMQQIKPSCWQTLCAPVGHPHLLKPLRMDHKGWLASALMLLLQLAPPPAAAELLLRLSQPAGEMSPRRPPLLLLLVLLGAAAVAAPQVASCHSVLAKPVLKAPARSALSAALTDTLLAAPCWPRQVAESKSRQHTFCARLASSALPWLAGLLPAVLLLVAGVSGLLIASTSQGGACTEQ